MISDDGMGAVRAVRLQLSRKKGFDLQAHSWAVNGLPAVKVSRPTKLGNPWRVRQLEQSGHWFVEGPRLITPCYCGNREGAQLLAVKFFRQHVNEGRLLARPPADHNLACWCAADDPVRSLNDSGLPQAMIFAGGEAYDELTMPGAASRTLDLDSCALAVGIYRAMTGAGVKGAALSPPPAVPESVRRLSEAASQGEWAIWREPIQSAADAIQELAQQVEQTDPLADSLYLLSARGKCPATTGCGPTSAANAEFIVGLVNWVRTLLATPSGRADTPPGGDGAVEGGKDRTRPPNRPGTDKPCFFVGSTGYDAECRTCGLYTRDYEREDFECPWEGIAAPTAPEPAAAERYEKARAIAEAAANRWDAFRDTAGVNWLTDAIMGMPASRASAPEPAASGERETQQRADILLALEAALVLLGRHEPGDSRAVSDEFVAMASAVVGCMNDDGRQILLSIMAGPAPNPVPAEPQAAGDGWSFDMEAAPRDGTVILLWRKGWGEPSAAYWGLAPQADGASVASKRHPWVFLDSTNGLNGYEDGEHGPTAWHVMLSAPPESPADAEGGR